MRFKYLFLSMLLLILAFNMGAIAAEDATIGDYSFTIPEDYNITNQTDDVILLEDSVQYYSLSITDVKENLDNEEILKRLMSQGYELEKEGNSTKGIFNVTEYTYNFKDAYYGFLYICENGDDKLVITHGTSGEDEYFLSAPDFDVNDILDSMEKN